MMDWIFWEMWSFKVPAGLFRLWMNRISGKKMLYSPADLILHIELGMLEKNLYYIYIFSNRHKFSATFLVTIIRHRPRNIAKTSRILRKLYLNGMYHLGTNFIFSSIYIIYNLQKLHDYQTYENIWKIVERTSFKRTKEFNIC